MTEPCFDGLVLVKSKSSIKLVENVPNDLSATSVFCLSWDCVPSERIVSYIQGLQTKGEAIGIIPCGKQIYDTLLSAGIVGKHVDRKWIIVPSNAVTNSPLSDSKILFVGEVFTPSESENVLLLTLAEAALKSKMHLAQMSAALLSRIRPFLPSPHYYAVRRGDLLIDIRYRGPPTTVNHTRVIPIRVLALIPGIANIYDPNTPGDPSQSTRSQSHGLLLAEGAGGIPVLSSQTTLCLLSGGIDSPVAAYRMMTRGCFVDCVHFLNSTTDTVAILNKLNLICQRLSSVQGSLTLYTVDVCVLQTAIIGVAAPSDRTLLYKLYMLLLASHVDNKYLALIVGDAVGQVASQTLNNISSLYSLVPKAVLAPLHGTHKPQVIREAQHVGLYDASILPGSDCCQYLSCPMGANLKVSVLKLREYVKKIGTIPPLPVTMYRFIHGEEITSERRTVMLEVPPSALLYAENESCAGLQEKTDTSCAIPVAPPSKTLYLDSAARSFVAVEVRRAMLEAPDGNPNSVHTVGRAARSAIEQARFSVLQALGCADSNHSLIFTSGGTESNNLAMDIYKEMGIAGILVSGISHSSLKLPAMSVGAKCVVEWPVDTKGFLRIDVLNDFLLTHSKSEGICVVCLDLVNNELGVLQDYDAMLKLIRNARNTRIHVDACQSFLKVPSPKDFDSLSISGHKVNGPTGIGALVIKKNILEAIQANTHDGVTNKGGGQEYGVRSGTENVISIVGLDAAITLPRPNSHIEDVFTYLTRELTTSLPFRVNTPLDRKSGYIIHVTYVGTNKAIKEEVLVSQLATQYNIMVSTGAACHSTKSKFKTTENVAESNATDSSELYKALAISQGPTLRISYDYTITLEDCRRLIGALQAIFSTSN